MESYTAVSTVISMLMSQYLGISQMISLTLVPVISSLLGKIVENSEYYQINIKDITAYLDIYTYLIYLAPIIILYMLRNKIKSGYSNILAKFDKTVTFNIYTYSEIQRFSRFFNILSIHGKKTGDFIEYKVFNKGSSNCKDMDIYGSTDNTRFKIVTKSGPIYGYVRIAYYESKETVTSAAQQTVGPTGAIVTTSATAGSQSNQQVDVKKNPYLIIKFDTKISYSDFEQCVNTKIKEYDDYIKQKKVILYGQNKSKPRTTAAASLSSVGGIHVTIDSTQILNIKKKDLNKSKIFDDYYYSNKDFLSKLIKFDTFNILLHGPSGCGKSKLIQTIAILKERHIMIVDVLSFKKQGLHANISKSIVDGRYVDSNELVVVLEDFDKIVEYLLLKEKNLQKKIRAISDTPKFTSDIITTYENQLDELDINFLLDILQPSIPYKNRIIIATTSNYDYIKTVLPALGNSGRLKPIHIGYVDQTVFEQILHDHFPNILSIDIILPENHSIKTSTILDTAKMYKDDYKLFKKVMMDMIKKDIESKPDMIVIKGSKLMVVDHDIQEIITTIMSIPKYMYNKDKIWEEYFSKDKSYLQKLIKLPSFNLLLHGPPGTGKSKFIEILSKVLQRHIITVCLKYHTKYEANKIISTPSIENVQYKPKDVIIVFEEFDQVIDRLHTNTDSNNALLLGDLLELFQSCIPREGQIIIATSNNFEQMYKKLPALFRPGRLTPIYMGNIDQETFNQIVKYYIPDADISDNVVLPEKHSIPTSQIVEQLVIADGDYDSFKTSMKKIIG